MLKETADRYIEHACEIYPPDGKPVVSVRKMRSVCHGNYRMGMGVARYLCRTGLAEPFRDDTKNKSFTLHIGKMRKYLEDKKRSKRQPVKTDGVVPAGAPDFLKG